MSEVSNPDESLQCVNNAKHAVELLLSFVPENVSTRKKSPQMSASHQSRTFKFEAQLNFA